jgi:hypothetical protein
LEKARIPRFDSGNSLHRGIAEEAKRLSKGSADVELAFYPTIDLLCARLWGVDEKALKAVQRAYAELYVSDGKGPDGENELEEGGE